MQMFSSTGLISSDKTMRHLTSTSCAMFSSTSTFICSSTALQILESTITIPLLLRCLRSLVWLQKLVMMPSDNFLQICLSHFTAVSTSIFYMSFAFSATKSRSVSAWSARKRSFIAAIMPIPIGFSVNVVFGGRKNTAVYFICGGVSFTLCAMQLSNIEATYRGDVEPIQWSNRVKNSWKRCVVIISLLFAW